MFPVGKQQKFLYQSFQTISHRLCVDKAVYTPYLEQSKPILSLINSTEFVVMEALKFYNNSSSSPNGISFKLLKAVMLRIIRPPNIIYQQSLNQGIFPRMWQHAAVISLYKGRGG